MKQNPCYRVIVIAHLVLAVATAFIVSRMPAAWIETVAYLFIGFAFGRAALDAVEDMERARGQGEGQ